MTEQPGDFRITFRALPDAVPVGRRLAQLLKFALRRCRLKNVGAVEVPQPEPEPQPQPQPEEQPADGR